MDKLNHIDWSENNMTSNVNKKFIRALKGEAVVPPPLWLMRQAGRHLEEYRALRAKNKNFLKFCYSPDLATEATLQPILRYGLDAAILFSDILVIPDALGQQVEFVSREGPKLDPVSKAEDLKIFDRSGLHDHLAPVYETITRIKKKLPKETSLIGFAGAPWTVATYMVEGGSSKDYQKTRTWAYQSPQSFSMLIDLLVDTTSDYLIRQIDAGVEAIQIFDSWAGVLPPGQFEQWALAPVKEIIRRICQSHPDIPVIGFPRGAGFQYVKYAKEAGVDAVSLDSTVPLEWAAENIQPICAVQGNLDNLALLAGGEIMEQEVCRILQAFSGGPFVFNLGHGILPETPVPHVERLVELVRARSTQDHG